MRKLSLPIFALMVILSASMLTWAQTSATSSVSGTITDASGAVIAGAEIEFLDSSTNQSRKVTTNGEGRYQLPSILPGVYKVTVRQRGFRTTQVPAFKVDISKAYTLDLTMAVGDVGETVEIVAGAALELQKADATIGNVIGGETLKNLPSLSRDTTALVLFQPLVAPQAGGEGDGTGGQVAGARSDQNTFMLDGGDASSNTEGNGGYNSNFTAVPRAVVPTPAESIQEFRVATNNAGANFGRSAGAQVALETKRGTNALHGSAYWYHQNDNLNAASWTNKRTLAQNISDPERRAKIQKPELKDNRYGFSLGGPIIRDRTFIFGHYEGRRFPKTEEFLRLVPTNELKNGILRFRDSAGTITSYNLATSTACGGGNCDPRGLGISPVVKSVWGLLPAGNDPSQGDGLNYIGYRGNVAIPLTEDFAVARLDHRFSDKWQFMGSYRYARTIEPSRAQVDITNGKNEAKASSPLQPRYVVAGLTGQLSSTMVNEFRFNYLRHWWEWARFSPAPQVNGTAAALAIAGEGLNSFIDEPINVDTQNARSRVWNGRDFNFQDNLSWVKGSHSFNFGGKILHQSFFHQRDDKVVGGLTSLVYQIEDGANAIIGGAYRPPTCGGAVTTNCIQSGDLTAWNKLYASTLGIMDRAAVLLTRDGSLNPQPAGTPLRENVIVKAYEAYASDTWRWKPSLTFSYGLSYNIQQPPTERQQKQTLLLADGKVLETESFLRQRQEAALAGRVFNPELSVQNVAGLSRKYPYDPDYNNFSPRFAAAWSPSFSDGWLGKLVGQNKTVLRGGYSLAYDRINGVGIVMIPILGIGYGQLSSCQGPNRAGQCIGGTTADTAFRIGVDGSSVALPSVARPTLPLVPGKKDPFELLSFQIDVRRSVGRNHSADFTIQRELPGNMLVEAGWVGRFARGLYQGLDLNQVPFFMKAPGGNQTFAQAYDALAAQIRGGINPTTNPGAITSQEWFEKTLAGSTYCTGRPSCTLGVAQAFSAQIDAGQVYTIFRAFDIANAFVTGPVIGRRQVEVLYMITDLGRSNYNAFFVSLQKRASAGLTFAFNYTLSKSLDQRGFNQANLGASTNAFDLDYDYGPSLFDRRHIVNSYFNYELPFGKGKNFSTGNWLDQVIGGWRVSGAFVATSGLPYEFTQGTSQEFGQAFSFGNPTGLLQTSGGSFKVTRNEGVVGSNNIGTTAAGSGSGINAFGNPEQVYKSFRRVNLATDTRHGRGLLRGFSRWSFDLSLGKRIAITEQVNLGFTADFTNVFNQVQLSDPSLSFTNPRGFGVITGQYNRPRFIQLGLRFEF